MEKSKKRLGGQRLEATQKEKTLTHKFKNNQCISAYNVRCSRSADQLHPKGATVDLRYSSGTYYKTAVVSKFDEGASSSATKWLLPSPLPNVRRDYCPLEAARGKQAPNGSAQRESNKENPSNPAATNGRAHKSTVRCV